MALTYTYDATTLATDTTDHVRFLIGDTQSPWLLSNEEIAAVLGMEANVYKAAAECCRRVLGQYARKPNKSVGGLSVNYATITEHFRKLAEDLERRGLAHQVPTAGGISIADKKTLQEDTDWPRPDFSRGQHDRTDIPSSEPYVSPEELS